MLNWLVLNILKLNNTILNIELSKYLLPEGILDYFDIVSNNMENYTQFSLIKMQGD